MEFVNNIDYWWWLTGGLVLIVLEVLLPGTVLLWMGLSSLVVGVVLFIFPSLPIEYQTALFALLSVATVAYFRKRLSLRPTHSDNPNLNSGGFEHVGKKITLTTPLRNGASREVVGETTWKIKGEDADEGDTVTVTGVEGTSLVVIKD